MLNKAGQKLCSVQLEMVLADPTMLIDRPICSHGDDLVSE